MLQTVLLGAGFAFAAAVQPGPLQAFLLSRTIAQGVRRTLPAAFAPLVSDFPIALVVLLVLRAVPPSVQRGLRGAGGVFLLWLAWSAFRDARQTTAGERAAPARTFASAVLVNLLNPNPYLGWALVLGPALMAAWARGARDAVSLVIAFYGTMTLSLAAFILLCGSTRALGPGIQRALLLLSAASLAALGVWQLVVALVSWAN